MPANGQKASRPDPYDALLNVPAFDIVPERLKTDFSPDQNLKALELAKQARVAATAGELDKAIVYARSALNKVKVKYGADHLYTAYVLDDLASWYLKRGFLEDARQASEQALGIVQAAKGERSVEFAKMSSTLGSVEMAQGKIRKAFTRYQLALDVFSTSSHQLDVSRLARGYRNCGIAATELGQRAAALEYFQHAFDQLSADGAVRNAQQFEFALALAKAERNAELLELAVIRMDMLDRAANDLALQETSLWVNFEIERASLSIAESRLLDAEQRLLDVIEFLQSKSALKKISADAAALQYAQARYQLAFAYVLKGQLVEAEPLYRQVLVDYRRLLGSGHPAVARTLHGMAIVFKNLGFYQRSEKFYEKALTIFRTALGEESAAAAATILEYSLLTSQQGKHDLALSQAQAAHDFFMQQDSEWNLQKGFAQSALGTALFNKGDLVSAEKAFRRAIQWMEKARGSNAVDLPPALAQLAEIYLLQDKNTQAREAIKRAVSIYELSESQTPFALANANSIYAEVLSRQGENEAAISKANQVLDIILRRLTLSTGRAQGLALEEQRRSRRLFTRYFSVVYPLRARDEALTNSLFAAVQYPIASGTASMVARMSARLARADSELAELIREREGLLNIIDRMTGSMLSDFSGLQKPNTQIGVNTNRNTLQDLESRFKGLDTKLQLKYPSYFQLVSPTATNISELQAQLRKGEAVFTHMSTEEGSYLFLVRPESTLQAKTSLSDRDLARLVASIRSTVELGGFESIRDLPHFNHRSAYLIYKGLFSPFDDELDSVKHLITVFDGAMQNLNPALLLREPQADKTKYKDMPFLGKQLAITVSPSVGSIIALRQLARRDSAPKPFLGVGDPNLDAKAASFDVDAAQDVLRTLSFQVNPGDIRLAFGSLPETREELDQISNLLGGDPKDLYYRERASERLLKAIDLSEFKVVAFATHGLLAGDFSGLAEPALVLTPPEDATALDNGLLTSSEIVELEFNADWVLLSACNTAGPSRRAGAEGLSGLAKAFFYAGSRSLLVSHWSVDSEATVSLTTSIFEILKAQPNLSKAEALKLSVEKLISGSPREYYSHPAFWAAFSLVGGGG